jgi:hypothetical protein
MKNRQYLGVNLVIVMLLCTIILYTSCSSTNKPIETIYTPSYESTITKTNVVSECPISYEKYQMKAGDIRLVYFPHPLFTLEYPKDFKVLDFNQTTGSEVSAKYSDVVFKGPGITLAGTQITIRVQKTGFEGFSNANEKFQDMVLEARTKTDNVTVSKVITCGITADYLEYSQKINEPINGPEYYYFYHYMSSRVAVFDYAGLIWEITLEYHYVVSEPTHVSKYFSHIIETFKILN